MTSAGIGGQRGRDRDREHEPERNLALLLTATPSLRAKLFANPTKQVGRSLPSGKYWDYGSSAKWNLFVRWSDRRKARRELAEAVLRTIAEQVERHELAATVNTDAVFEDFFAPIVKASQWSFSSVTLLSWGTFMVGVGLIIAGVVVAISPPAHVNSTVIASIFGGSGAVSALGAVYATAKRGIRQVTADVARLRMVLTAFATQLGQLRALAEAAPQPGVAPANVSSVTRLNKEITTAMKGAVDLIPIISDSSTDAASGSRKRAASSSAARNTPPRKNGRKPTPAVGPK